MSNLVPLTPPTSRTYFDQQLGRLRLAIKSMRAQFAEIERRMREVETDLVNVEAALDQLEEDAKKDTAV